MCFPLGRGKLSVTAAAVDPLLRQLPQPPPPPVAAAPQAAPTNGDVGRLGRGQAPEAERRHITPHAEGAGNGPLGVALVEGAGKLHNPGATGGNKQHTIKPRARSPPGSASPSPQAPQAEQRAAVPRANPALRSPEDAAMERRLPGRKGRPSLLTTKCVHQRVLQGRDQGPQMTSYARGTFWSCFL